ncbi:MAG: phosphoenolpyruvate--protein phosphotransferase [Geminicoccaceae bacterium]|nr:MAG: phosphoenolpyruvate--protein phosphotransferase [Geminicoccaceae bacterium]
MSAGWGAAPSLASESRGAELSAARRLLRRIMELAAAPIRPQQRLDRIVNLIATDMVAEVCSIYVRRAGNIMELFATQGLRLDAVHQTRMRAGEGLVGHIAQTAEIVNTSEAQNDPRFQYFPETGEEIYRSFLGVPILRGGEVAGVIVVQNTAARAYAEDEVEALEIIATLLGEMLASGGLVDAEIYTDLASISAPPQRLVGTALVRGVALGHAVLHHPPPRVTRFVSDNPGLETARLERAMQALRLDVDRLVASAGLGLGEHGDVLEAYRMLSHDRSWFRRLHEAILTGLTAEAAVRRVQEETKARLSHSPNAYLRERLLDLDDLANRLLGHLVGTPRGRAPEDLPDRAIVIARTLSAAELLDYDRERLKGLVLEEGSHTAHATIIARALEIPVLGGVDRAFAAVREQDIVALDADHGQVFVRPSEDVVHAFDRSLAARQAARARIRELRHLPTVSRDGVGVDLSLNAAFLMDLDSLADSGAIGIGLYRTELAYMVRAAFPGVQDQTELYTRVVTALEGRPCTFRTLDVGSDKILPYWRFPHEENPAMGWRALRLTLDQPSLLRHQLRALIRAHGVRPMRVMFPMVAEVAEFDRAKALLDLELDRARRRGEPTPERVEVGAMLEVPALLFQLDRLLERIAFLSVGTNDLLQFFFACDRGSPRLNGRYDALSPAVLHMIRHLVERCRKAGVRLSVCGEMASRPLDAIALVALGVRDLSVTSASIGPIKAVIRSLDVGATCRFLMTQAELPVHSVRDTLYGYVRDRNVDLPEEGLL